jgi:hypothetical protein
MDGVEAAERGRVEQSREACNLRAQLDERDAVQEGARPLDELRHACPPHCASDLDRRDLARDSAFPIAEELRERGTLGLEGDELHQSGRVEVDKGTRQLDPVVAQLLEHLGERTLQVDLEGRAQLLEPPSGRRHSPLRSEARNRVGALGERSEQRDRLPAIGDLERLAGERSPEVDAEVLPQFPYANTRAITHVAQRSTLPERRPAALGPGPGLPFSR